MFFYVLLTDVLCQLVITCVVPSWRHDQIKKFVFYSRSANNVSDEIIEFAKVYVEEISCIDVACDAILDFDILLFRLIGLEDAIPHIEQIAKVRVHIQGVACVVDAVVGGRKNEFTEKAETCIFHEVLADVYKTTPGAVDEHDRE